MNFEEYLLQFGHTKQTVRTYTYIVGIFKEKHPSADTYQYRDILGYFENAEGNRNYRNTILASLKRYYDYLIEIGFRNDHPCMRLFLKGNKRNKQVIVHDLFSSEELELLLNRKERYQDLKLRNQIVFSLLIYQALTAGEIASLKTSHVDLDTGTIFIQGTTKLSKRTLDLHPKQFKLIDNYLNTARAKLQSRRPKTNALILGKLGTPISVDDINYLIETGKPLFPDRNLTSVSIRQSVISNWLNEKKLPLEQVQLWAGHKWISSTATYRQTSIEEQRELMNRWHPLG